MRASRGFAFSPPKASTDSIFRFTTNYCDLGFCLAKDGRRLVLVSCIDNLLKAQPDRQFRT